MAINIIDKLPYEKTVYWLLNGANDRKTRVKAYIDKLVERWPSLKTRIGVFWTDNQEEYNNLVDASLDNDWRAFFNKFNIEADIIKLVNIEALKEVGELFKPDISDNLIVKDLKEATQSSQHVDYLPDYFADLSGGVCWVMFVLDAFKDFYLGQLSSHLKDMFGEDLSVSEVNAIAWKKTISDIYGDLYSSFTKVEYESDLDDLRKNLGEHMIRLDNLIIDAKHNKIKDKLTSALAELNSTKEQNTKLWTFTNKLTQRLEYIYSNYPEILYGTSGSSSSDSSSPSNNTTGNTTPDKPPTPDPVIIKPKPDENQQPKPQPQPDPVVKPIDQKPDDTPKPDEGPKPPSPEEVAAKELQALKDEIIKLPLNETEKSVLTKAKNKEEAEAVRTQYNQRVGEAAAEEGRYDTLLNDIQKETELKKLEDGEHYDTEIGKLKTELLPTSKQLSALQTKRRERKAELVKKQLQEAKDNALTKDISGNNWDPVLEEEEQKLINSANDPEEVKKYQTQIEVKRDSIKSAADLLDSLNNWTDITTLPKMEEIRAKYQEDLVPTGLKYNDLKKARNDIRLTLFKDRFEKPTSTKLSDTEIDKWRDSSEATGLTGLGTEERTAFLNGWTIEGIKERKIAVYSIKAETEEKVQEINPLAVNKEQLDKALKILASINDPAKTTFKSLPEEYRKDDIAGLPTDLPGIANPTNLKARILARRSTFVLSLNKEDDEAFTQEKLDTILTKIKEKYPANEYTPFSAEIANKVLKYNVLKENPTKKVGKETVLLPIPDLVPNIDEDLDEWLTSVEQKGYRIENEPKQMIKGNEMTGAEALKQENEWIETNQRDKQGKLLLPFFCAKVGYDPNLPEKFFCEEGNSTKGCIPFSTGIGKSTKTMMCLEFIMEQIDKIWKQTDKRRNVVLVLPTEVLTSSVANHHNSWLQEYECPIHDIKHGEYKVNKDEIAEGLSILYFPYLLGYVARNLVKTKGSEGGKKFDLSTVKDIQDKLQTIQGENKLKDLDPILVFDEADFADGEYRALMEGCVMKGLKVMKMSATFPGVPWSITTSYPLTTKKVDGFKPDHIKPEDKTAIFIRNKLTQEQKDILNDKANNGKNAVCWVEFDASMAPAVEGITIGMPQGTAFFMTFAYDRGVSMDIKNVIITNWIETTKLGDMDRKVDGKVVKGKGFWYYSDPVPQKSPIGSLGQQRGRVSRLYPGNCYILVDKDGKLEYEEIKPTDDVGTVFTQAVFTGDTSKIKYGMFQKSLNLTLLSLAWPDKFGLRPEEILIGVQQGGIPPNIFPKFDIKQPSQGCDADLWDKYMKIEKPSEIPKSQAQDILSNMIGNLMISPGKVNNFPKLVSVEINSPLINRIDWLASKKYVKDKDPQKPGKWVAQNNKASILECQKMINGAIEKVLMKLPDYEPGKVSYKNETTFNKIVDIYKCVDGLTIAINQDFTEDWIDKKNQSLGKKPKDNLTVKITYNAPASSGGSTFIK